MLRGFEKMRKHKWNKPNCYGNELLKCKNGRNESTRRKLGRSFGTIPTSLLMGSRM